jgi:hypothetical protein
LVAITSIEALFVALQNVGPRSGATPALFTSTSSRPNRSQPSSKPRAIGRGHVACTVERLDACSFEFARTAATSLIAAGGR